ncbi:MAG: hypothetical protein ABF290_16750 [Thiogranum sp.]
MTQKTLSIVLIAMLGGAACSTDMEQTMSIDAAQKASGKAADVTGGADTPAGK